MKIWVNGCFDILHLGHIELLRYAKSQGDYLIVGIDSDKRVREAKGDTRPFHNQFERQRVLEAIRYVDDVVIFDSDEDLADLIKAFKIRTMIVGSDWKGKPIIGSENAKEVVYFDRIEKYSTTRILKGI